MKDWKDMTPGEYLDFLKAELAKVAAKREEPKPLPPAKPWDHARDGHRWICIASGHGVETVECTECGIVKDFDV